MPNTAVAPTAPTMAHRDQDDLKIARARTSPAPSVQPVLPCAANGAAIHAAAPIDANMALLADAPRTRVVFRARMM